MQQLHPNSAGRVRVPTTLGVPVGQVPRLSPAARARVRAQLELGVFMISFEEIGGVRDISSDPARVNLVTIRDDRVLARFDALVAIRRAR